MCHAFWEFSKFLQRTRDPRGKRVCWPDPVLILANDPTCEPSCPFQHKGLEKGGLPIWDYPPVVFYRWLRFKGIKSIIPLKGWHNPHICGALVGWFFPFPFKTHPKQGITQWPLFSALGLCGLCSKPRHISAICLLRHRRLTHPAKLCPA